MPSEGNTATVLVVDDEAVNRELLRAVLSHDGHDVLVAESGERALELLESHQPRLIIVDLYLSGMNGTQLIKHIRTDRAFADTPIALYTGSDINAALRDFMELMKVRHVIPKPAEPEAIIAAVHAALA